MRRAIAVVAVGLAALTTACSAGDDTEPTPLPTIEQPPTPAQAGSIDVTLGEWSVLPDPEQAAAGTVDLEISNQGKVLHELVVIETDLDAGDLPTTSDGAIDEDKVDVVTEAEDIQPDARADLAPDLDAGTYVLACNIVDETEDGSVRSHYKLGMRTGFTVS